MPTPKAIWISSAYKICALQGFDALKVEPLAKFVGVSKSSFYHHFADLESFLEAVLEHHCSQCVIIAQKEKDCACLYPDLIDILVAHRLDLLFHRQLRIHRSNSIIGATLEKANRLLGNYAVLLWAKEIHLKMSREQLEGLFEIATDDFYMRINEENVNSEFLTAYFKNLSKIASQFI